MIVKENTELNKILYEKLNNDKIKINWNKNPIEMQTFLSFLTVPVERSTDHLGYDTGWSLYFNKELKLKIGGGWVNKTHYLDSLQYGEKLQNRYNNYVNPFYLSDILHDDGIKFFVEYYEEDIQKIISDKRNEVEFHKRKLKEEKDILSKLLIENLHLQSY